MSQQVYIHPVGDKGRPIGDQVKELALYVDENEMPLRTFGPISRINILVGPTNSGKSRFMRGLAKSPSYHLCALNLDAPDLSHGLSACRRLVLKKDAEPLVPEFSPSDFTRILDALLSDLRETQSGTNIHKRRERLMEMNTKYQTALQELDTNALPNDTIKDIKTVSDLVASWPSAPFQRKTPSRVYIPVLRTAVSLEESSASGGSDFLARSIQQNYQLGSSTVEVFTGNQLYSAIDTDKRTSIEALRQVEDFEQFLGTTFFDGMHIRLQSLPPDYRPKGGHLALSIDWRFQRLFYDLGDGIQATIILLYKLFTAQEGTWFFIEEPEQGLHPGLQRIFLETLAQNESLQKREHTVFMSTHSNHLLGMAMTEFEDISVFAFQRHLNREEQFQIRPIQTPEHNLLKALGVANSSVFLANCGIWVEGITDRLYLRAYLKAYLDSKRPVFEPQEDIHYAFFEYGGSNLAHYLFEAEDDEDAEQIHAQFLCNRIFLIVDKGKGRDVKRHNYLKEVAARKSNFTFCVTPGTEVENLLSCEMLKQALPELAPKKAPALAHASGVLSSVRENDYSEEYIGKYIESVFDLPTRTISAETGTLKTGFKVRLAELVVASNVTWDKMSDDARRLAEELYDFIWQHNQITQH